MSMIPFPRKTLEPPLGMPDRRGEPYRDAPAAAETCLLIIDMISPFSFPDAEKMFPAVVEVAGRIARLKQRAAAAGMSTIYVNDNFGKWRHDFGRLVDHCLNEPCRGRRVAEVLHPTEDDYFVLKPKHSGFYATPLELLLKFLGARRLIVTGVAGDNCILYTAADAYMREFTLCTPADCIVSIDARANQGALEHMRTNLKADLRYSDEVDLSAFH
jgi:nicotinamidase-related amidase